MEIFDDGVSIKRRYFDNGTPSTLRWCLSALLSCYIMFRFEMIWTCEARTCCWVMAEKKTVRTEQHFKLHWELSNAVPSRLSCKCVRIWTHRLCLQADVSFEAACRNIYNLTQRKAKSGFLQSGDNVACHFGNNLVCLPFLLVQASKHMMHNCITQTSDAPAWITSVKLFHSTDFWKTAAAWGTASNASTCQEALFCWPS